MAEPNWRALVGARTHTELVERALTELADSGTAITNLNVGGLWRTLTEFAMRPLAWVWDDLATLLRNGYRRYADAPYIDLAMDDLGLERLEELATVGQLRFVRTAGGSGNVVIPADVVAATQVSASGEVLRYLVTTQTVLVDGDDCVLVPIEAETVGAAYNVSAGLITELSTPIVGIGSVTNDEDWITTEGRDEEDTEAYRARGDNRWPQLSRGATADAYKGRALDAGAVSASVDDLHPRGPGTVDVVITGPDGMPSSALLAAVQAYIDDGRAPQCVDVLVRAPSALSIDVVLAIVAHPDTDDARVEAMETEGAARVVAFFDGAEAGELADDESAVTGLGSGDDFALGRLLGLVAKMRDLYDVEAPDGQASVSVAADELAVLGGVTVSVTRAGAR